MLDQLKEKVKKIKLLKRTSFNEENTSLKLRVEPSVLFKKEMV